MELSQRSLASVLLRETQVSLVRSHITTKPIGTLRYCFTKPETLSVKCPLSNESVKTIYISISGAKRAKGCEWLGRVILHIQGILGSGRWAVKTVYISIS